MTEVNNSSKEIFASSVKDLAAIKELKIKDLTNLEEMRTFLSEEDIKAGMRKIEGYHVTALSEVETKDLPPLLVGYFDGKYILLGGYHRRQSRKEKLEREMKLAKNPDVDGEELATILKAKLSESQLQELEDRYNNTHVPVNVIEIEDAVQLIFAAQEDNLKNGLALQGDSRTMMARWAYLKGEELYLKGLAPKMPTYRKTADKYGIKGQTLFNSVKKWKEQEEEKKAKEAKEAAVEDGENVVDNEPLEKVETYDSKKAAKEAVKLFKAITTFVNNTGQNAHETQRIADITKGLGDYNKSAEEKKTEEKDDTLDVGDLENLCVWLLASTQPTSKNLVNRLNNVLHPPVKK
jgi:hypothetical protein